MKKKNFKGNLLEFDFARIRTFSVQDRKNLVTRKNILIPKKYRTPVENSLVLSQNPEFEELAERIRQAKRKHRPIIWSLGGHVIKAGLSRYLIELMKSGFVQHLAGNGAVSIHDFELAYLGGTSEDVTSALEDGTFGMWEETGRWMNQAIRDGWLKRSQRRSQRLGYGESLAVYIDKHPKRFPYRDISVLYQGYQCGIPVTFHIALGTDIIHQHPNIDFSALGGTAGIDFKKYCESVTQLEGGVFLNFGSAVIGPEVFLKALSIARNLGFKVKKFTTANFDLLDLGNYRTINGHNIYHYYYRPWKNIVSRPVSLGGKGFHFSIDHKVSIPLLYQKLITPT